MLGRANLLLTITQLELTGWKRTIKGVHRLHREKRDFGGCVKCDAHNGTRQVKTAQPNILPLALDTAHASRLPSYGYLNPLYIQTRQYALYLSIL